MSPTKLRIAMISPTLGSAFGLEQVLMTSVKGLRSRGHEVFLIGERAFESLPKSESPTLTPGLLSTPALLKPAQLKRVKQAFLKALENINPDILHFLDQPHAALIDLATSLYSCVLTAHTVAPTCPASHRLANDTQVCDRKSGWSCLLQNKSFHCLENFKTDLHRSHVLYEFESKRRATKKMKAIIAISRYIESKLLENGFSESQVNLIYNPLPQWDFVESTAFKTPLLVSACRLVPLKGLEFTIRALKEIESLDWEYWILGEGPLSEPLKSLVKSLKLDHKIIFKGKTPREKTLEIVKSATVFLQTNVGPEGFGLSVAEALSLGTPAIAFDTPALNEIIEHGKNGFLVKAKDIASLSKTIQALLQDPKLRAELSRYGQEKTPQTFSEHAFIDSTLQLYTRII